MSKRQKITDRDRRIGKILAILREVEAQPRDWAKGKDSWKERVAAKHKVAKGSIYRWIDKYGKRGIAGLEHRKSSREKPKAWTPEALDFWLGLCLIPQKRELSLKVLYEDLIHEAQLRDWHVGGWSSAKWWLVRRAKLLMRILP